MERLTRKETDKMGDYVFVNGENTCPNEIATKLGKYEDLMEKYAIESVEYLEQCIKRSDKYGELAEQIGCPLEVYAQLKYDTPIFDQNGDKWFIEAISRTNVIHAVKINHEKKIHFEDKWFNVSDYKKTWWLKEDRSE